jgi:nucleoside-diphosphate-sugar epimerase
MAYHRKYGMKTAIARIFSTYGPRMKLDDGRVVPAFLDQALRNEPVTIFGDGSQTPVSATSAIWWRVCIACCFQTSVIR